MKSLTKNESGLALVTVLLVLMLTSGLMAGMFAALLANDRSHATDRDQSVAYAAAHAGLEKLTAGLAALFGTDFSPSAAQLDIVDNFPPEIEGFEYVSPEGGENSGYEITFTEDPGPGANIGNPMAFPSADITTGPFEGFKGLITPYTLTVTARSTTGNSEVRLRRELQTVAVPVFQFGIFGQNSLGFHAGPSFNFGGRVHTNQVLYLAQGDGNTLTFTDKITAFISVVRNTLSNGVGTSFTDHEGVVTLPTVIGGAPGTYRPLLAGEGSGTTASPWAGWKNLSEVTYRTNVRTEATGAKVLNLPLTSQGAQPIDLIRRPAVLSDEDTNNAAVFGQRYFAQASLRILLSDRTADLTNLPTITAGAPFDLTNLAASGYVVAAGRTPVAAAPVTEPFTVATGASNTRLSAVAGGTLTFQTWNGAAWVNGPVPPWLKWSIVAGAGSTCTGLTGVVLSGCGVHAAYGAGTAITFTRFDGTTLAAQVAGGGAGLNSATININPALPAPPFTTARQYVASRVFYVGEDPVTCTGYTLNTLTGCTAAGVGPVLTVNDPVYTGATTTVGTPLLSGFLKIEKQDAAGVWTDVTLELLNLGFADRNFGSGDVCTDPTPNAVLRFQRLRDNALPAGGCAVNANSYNTFAGVGGYPGWSPTDFVPLNLYDAREGNTRLQGVGVGIHMGGVMGYVALDAANFARWVAGAIGATGNQALNNNGYIVYFSDRRGDHDETAADVETGEYGNEDSINPAAAVWAKTNLLETGENFNESVDGGGVGTLQMYGETPHPLAVPAGAIANMRFDAASRPWDLIALNYAARGRLARPVLFRRALKVINGGMVGVTNPLPPSGFTVTSENPIYLQGNWNATAGDVQAEPNVPTAMIGDSVTLLSNAFNDAVTFQFPNNASQRIGTATGYRFAMCTGKAIPFPKPGGSGGGWGVMELGSDGGVHNFMKMLETWTVAGVQQNLSYRGSMVSLYYSRQAIGIYRADANIYGAPRRLFNFDADFLIPALLPPGTPMFRDINTLKFRQILRPNQ